MFRTFLLFILVSTRFVAGQTPSFGPPVRLADGAVELRLEGQAGAAVQIESSTNLAEWAVAASGVATNGTFIYRHPASANRALYSRGRSASDRLPPITATPQRNTNFTASGVGELSGATVVLNGTNFIRFTLNIPSNSVPDATILNLTYVTNLASLPFAGPLIGAVQIEPTNAVFWRGAAVEITYPTNLDRRKIVSFASEPDGSAFRLVIDRVYSNRVVIPISRGGVYGSVIATEQEINDMARREISGAAVRAEGTLRAAAEPDCQAAKKVRAEAIRAQIQRELNRRSSDIAAILGVERQRQLVGVAEDSQSLFEEVQSFICEFNDTQIKPHWPEAANNCALSKVLLQFTLSLERQRQLLGGGNEGCTSMSNLPICGAMENCLEEIGQCCDLGFKGPQKSAEVLSLQRQDQLLGSDCISNQEALDVIDRCSTNVWSGTFTVRAFGSKHVVTEDRGSVTIEIREEEGTFDGAVIESQEHGTASTGYQIALKVQGSLYDYDFESTAHDIQQRCLEGGSSSKYFLQESKTPASGTTIYTVNIATQPDGSYIMFAGNLGTTNLGIPARQTHIELEQFSDCDGGMSTRNRVLHEDELVVGYPMGLYQGRLTEPDPDTISGSTTAQDESGDFTTNFEFTWSFQRRRAGQ